MSNGFKVQRVLAQITDEGAPAERKRELHLYHREGRVRLSVRTFNAAGGWERTNLFGDGNSLVTVEMMPRKRPKRLAELGANLEAAADRLFDLMEGWDDDSRWSKQQRADFLQTVAIPAVLGELAQAA